MTYAVITEVFSGSYQVSCSMCLRDVGRMSKEELSHVIIREGDVRCFECEMLTCNLCRAVQYTVDHARDIHGSGMCKFCLMEYEHDKWTRLMAITRYTEKMIQQDTTARAALGRIEANRLNERGYDACLLGHISPRKKVERE